MKDRYIWPNANKISFCAFLFVLVDFALCCVVAWLQRANIFKIIANRNIFAITEWASQMNGINWKIWSLGVRHSVASPIQTNFIHWFPIGFIAFCLRTFVCHSQAKFHIEVKDDVMYLHQSAFDSPSIPTWKHMQFQIDKHLFVCWSKADTGHEHLFWFSLELYIVLHSVGDNRIA